LKRVCLVLLLLGLPVGAQTRREVTTSQSDEVVRVKTELVQTDVTVVDRRGRPVEGLAREQFELRVDGRPVELSFFEGVAAGSSEEEARLSAARGVKPGDAHDASADAHKSSPPHTAARGRVIFFFVDDMHLAPDSLSRARTSLLRFVDEQLAAGDRAAVVSASGQVGFLQQLTDNKAVLREAVGRLVYKLTGENYSGKVPISEADANRIQNRRDGRLFMYLVEATQNEYQMDLIMAAMVVRDRVRQANMNGRINELRTLAALLGLMRSSSSLPGRKLVFFISDGFVLDDKKSSGPEVMRRITAEAARVGAVVHTMDARGNFTDPHVSATRNDYVEFATRIGGRNFFDARATKEPLETLAAETGGRAFLNDNSLTAAFAEAAAESSSYYLMAWRPDPDAPPAARSRVEVVVKDRPDLRVRVRKHPFGAEPSADAAKPSAGAAKPSAGAAKPSADDELRAALASLYPRTGLPLALSAGYLDTADKGPVLTASMQLDSELLDFGGGDDEDAKPGGEAKADVDAGLDGEAKVDVWGIAIDDRGSYATFKQVLTVPRAALATAGQRHVLWNQQLPLPPGLYQLRVAARDRRTGRTGSQSQWVEIPRPAAAGRLSLSSVFLGEVKPGVGASARRVAVSVSRRFKRGSRLRFQAFVYGAAGTPVNVRARLVRDGATVLTLPASALVEAAARDAARVGYTGELELSGLAAGRYVLEVTAEGGARTPATQQAEFVLD
jgi:VWFA-related protein